MKNRKSEVSLETIISRHKKAQAEKWLFTILCSSISHALLEGVSKKDVLAVFQKACVNADDFCEKWSNREKN